MAEPRIGYAHPMNVRGMLHVKIHVKVQLVMKRHVIIKTRVVGRVTVHVQHVKEKTLVTTPAH